MKKLIILCSFNLVLNSEVSAEKLSDDLNCFLLFIPVAYPPVNAPAANMFSAPGYEGTVAGGGKKSQTHIFSLDGSVCRF